MCDILNPMFHCSPQTLNIMSDKDHLKVTVQGWKFSDFSLISELFNLTILKIIFEISSKRVSHDIMIDPDS